MAEYKAPGTPPAPPEQPTASQSPVDQVLALGDTRSLLDTPKAGQRVPAWYWALPLSFGLLGSVLSWFALKDRNRPVAVAMNWVGVVVTLLTAASIVFSGPLIGGLLGGAVPGQISGVTWPVSQAGTPTFYYFGVAGVPACDEMKPVVDVVQAQYADRIEFRVYGDLAAEPDAEAFAKRQGVDPTPTMVLTDASGKELNRWVGSRSEPELTAAFDAALK